MKDRLHQRYRRLIVASVIPLALLIVALSVYQFLNSRERELNNLRQSLVQQRVALNAIVKAADDHVQEMKLWAEDYLTSRTGETRSELRALFPSSAVGRQLSLGGGFLDDAPLRLRDKIGNFWGEPWLFERHPNDELEIDMALDLFPTMRLAHRSTPYFEWSYYFSGREDFVVPYPWITSAEILEDGGHKSVHDLLLSLFNHPLTTRALPKNNPGRKAYWIDPYLDQGGAGLVVSHAVPVYRDERFMGLAGADIHLAFLTRFLQEFQWPAGQVWIVNNSGHQVLADTEGKAATGEEVRTLATLIPKELRELDADQLIAASNHFREINGHQVLALTIKAVPWTMLYIVPNSEVRALVLPRLTPYAIILISLVLTFFVAQFFLRRWFVAPALNLVSYMDAESRQEGQALPTVPSIWRPWLAIIANAFKATRAKEAAEAANRAKSQFLATMSHELRTPLNGVLGYAQILLRDDGLTAKQRQASDVIYRSGQHLLGLINDILDLARIEAGKVEIKPVDFELPDLLRNIEAEFAARTRQKGLSFSLQVDPMLPHCVYGDEQKLRQILFNLIGNALKFTEQGEVVLAVRPDGHDVRFAIIDTGCGIASEELKQLFQPFRRVGSSAMRTEGTGLGLAISHSLVGLMGGTFEVNSALGEGSTFSFAVPLPTGARADMVKTIWPRRVTGYRGPRRRVLIVDDKIENRAVLADMLLPLGFEIAQAEDGEAALRTASEFKPDVILMDIRMPVMDGYEATRRLRQSPDLHRAVIIVVSASAFEHDRGACLKAGANDFLPKPFRQEALLELLRTHLGLEYTYAAETAAPSQVRGVNGNPQTLVCPPEHELAEFVDLARRGEIKNILKRATQLEQSDVRYAPFVAELRGLTQGIKIKELREFLKASSQP